MEAKKREDEAYAALKIVKNPDGSITRPALFPLSPSNSSSSSPVLSRDVPLNATRNTWIRIFRPQNPKPTQTHSLPVIIYFHGSGFILLSAASEPFHASCEEMALQIPALVASVEYRLAPEHPLPAAYDDAIDAVRWIRDQSHRDPWFDSADLSRCFLMGNSAGGTIAYYAPLRAVDLQTPPRFKIAGLILNEPFFGGVERTDSELRLEWDSVLPLSANDLMWRMALPDGADRDHEFCNPMVGGTHGDRVARLPRCLVTGHGRDPLVDRQRTLVRMLEGRGVHVVAHFDEDGFHGIEFTDPQKGQQLLMDVKDFVWASTAQI